MSALCAAARRQHAKHGRTAHVEGLLAAAAERAARPIELSTLANAEALAPWHCSEPLAPSDLRCVSISVVIRYQVIRHLVIKRYLQNFVLIQPRTSPPNICKILQKKKTTKI